MKRVSVIGISGAGKSTLARTLAARERWSNQFDPRWAHLDDHRLRTPTEVEGFPRDSASSSDAEATSRRASGPCESGLPLTCCRALR